MQTKLTQPAYLYYQYRDDLDLKLIMDVLNEHFQAYLDSINEMNLPIYIQHSGNMLDWIAKGIYGFDRLTIATGDSKPSYGGFANPPSLAAMPFTSFIPGTQTLSYKALSDDEFKRFLHWHLYLGDGFNFNIAWLKRRIKRFISDWFANVADTSDISVVLPERQSQAISGFARVGFASVPFLYAKESTNPLIDYNSTWKISITTVNANKKLAETFKWLVLSGKLSLPINNKYDIEIL